MSFILSFLTTTGFLFLAFRFYTLLCYLYILAWPAGNGVAKYLHGSDPTAIITGSSTGFGWSLANSLARHGFNIVLLSSNAKNLQQAKERLEKIHGPNRPEFKVHLLVVDATSATMVSDLDRAVDSIKHLNITILVNNLGGVPCPQPVLRLFPDFASRDLDATLSINIGICAHLIQKMLPPMTGNPSRNTTGEPTPYRKSKSCLLLNVSSTAQIGVPYVALYGACKAWLAAFSAALHRESYATGQHFDVLNLIAGEIQTRGNPQPVTLSRPHSQVLADCAVKQIGKVVRLGWLQWAPYWFHGIMYAMVSSIPETTLAKASADRQLRMMEYYEKNV